jgi:hypothetical protein
MGLMSSDVGMVGLCQNKTRQEMAAQVSADISQLFLSYFSGISRHFSGIS